jgi:hypothetical protein
MPANMPTVILGDEILGKKESQLAPTMTVGMTPAN